MKVGAARFVKSARDRSGWPRSGLDEILLVGRSNAGKSTLINWALARSKLARIAKEPGKTRALNFFNIDDKLMLVDAPGYGYARASKRERFDWSAMMSEYISSRVELRLALVALDSRREPSRDDFDAIALLERSSIGMIFVLTKIDKIARSKRKARADKIVSDLQRASAEVIAVSALSGAERALFWAKINQALPPRR